MFKKESKSWKSATFLKFFRKQLLILDQFTGTLGPIDAYKTGNLISESLCFNRRWYLSYFIHLHIITNQHLMFLSDRLAHKVWEGLRPFSSLYDAQSSTTLVQRNLQFEQSKGLHGMFKKQKMLNKTVSPLCLRACAFLAWNCCKT